MSARSVLERGRFLCLTVFFFYSLLFNLSTFFVFLWGCEEILKMAVGPCSVASTKASVTDNGYIYQVRSFARMKTWLSGRHPTRSISGFSTLSFWIANITLLWRCSLSQMSVRTVLQRMSPLENCCLATGERARDERGVWLCLVVLSNELQWCMSVSVWRLFAGTKNLEYVKSIFMLKENCLSGNAHWQVALGWRGDMWRHVLLIGKVCVSVCVWDGELKSRMVNEKPLLCWFAGWWFWGWSWLTVL